MSHKRLWIGDTFAPSRSIKRTQEGFGEESCMLHCPVCGYSYIHVEQVKEETQEEPNLDYISSDVYSYKTGATSIRFSGECGHRFSIVFGEHKGQVFIDGVRLENDPEGFDTCEVKL